MTLTTHIITRIMKKSDISYILKSLPAALLLMLTAGCDTGQEYAAPSGDTDGVVLMLPAFPSFLSSTGNASENELEYSSLSFFAFPQDGEGETFSAHLAPETGALDLKDKYAAYRLKLKPGKYKFFLTANYFTESKDLPDSEQVLKGKKIVYEDSFNGSVPKGGIPMSCDHGGFHGSDGTPLGEYCEIVAGKNLTIYADLTFACSKISVDATDFVGDAVAVTSVTVSNVSGNVPLFPPTDFTDYGSIGDKNVENTNEDKDMSSTFTFYLPERILAESESGMQSSAKLSIGDKEVILPLGEPAGISTDKTNPVPSPGSHRNVKRGTHYIYTLNAKGEAALKVEPWSTERILYNLYGQYFLHLDKTVYPVETGKETKIWYESNTGLEFESPEYTIPQTGTTLPLYIFRNEGDSICVSVNPEINSSEYSAITSDENLTGYNFFHIVAGNIHKRIDVAPLKLESYLNVSPVNISIDVREQIASGNYDGFFPIDINTNLKQLKIQRVDGWSTLPTSEWGESINPEEYVIMLSDQNGRQLTVGTDGHRMDVTEDRSGLRLCFNSLNSGKETWKEGRRLTFSITGLDESGNTVRVADESGNMTDLIRTVTINIIPNLQNYKIHFKADGWTNPHIYVYQCLEFPADWNQTFNGESLASKPIGYTVSNGGVRSCLAALEYSFTGMIAFKGWDHANNRNELYNDDGSYKEFTGEKEQGFFKFDIQEFDPSGDGCTWAASGNSGSVRFYLDMDFCKDHRAKQTCNDCKTSPYKLWPGIQMISEGNGWWVFELTGVATPGKALIMFNDTHGDNHRRFPANAAVGIPLFDFSNHEGWLYYNGDENDRVNNVFTNTDLQNN